MSSEATSLRAPQVRARHMQGVLAEVNRLPLEDRRAIMAAIRPETLEAIGQGSMLGWVPFAFDVECSRAIATHLGPMRAHDFFRGQILGVVETTLLAGMLQGAMRLAGADPRLYLPFLGKGFDILFHSCGRLTARFEAPNSAVVDLRGLPPVALEDQYWVGSVASALCGLAELIGFESSVVVTQSNERDGSVTLLSTWHARAASKLP
jgi:hypothetical protein